MSDQAQTEYVWTFFENGGMPSVFIKDTQRALNRTQRDEIRGQWRATYGNRHGGQHDIGILDMYQDVLKIGAGLSELDNDTLRQITESRICMGYHVPPLIVYAYVGLMRATYSNLKEAWSSFWDFTVSPDLKEWREFWTWNLLTEYEDETSIRAERYRLGWDLTNVAAVQEDVDAVHKRAREDYKAGLIMLNEGRAETGRALLEPTVGETFYKPPAKDPKDKDDEDKPSNED